MEKYLPWITWIAIFGIFWFLFIRPQRKQQKEHQDMVNNLKVGDEVTTIGGLKGKIVEIEEDDLTLELLPNEVNVTVLRRAIHHSSSADEEN